MHPTRVWLGAILLGSTMLLAACGNDSGASPSTVLMATPPAGTPVQAQAQSVGGIYAGTISSAKRNNTFGLAGAAPENGEGNAQFVEPATGWQYTLTLGPQADGSVGGTIYVYDPTGTYVSQGGFSGTYVSRSRLVGSYSTSTGDTGSLSLAYDNRYAAPTALQAIAGVYQWTSTRNGKASQVNVAAGGGFNGTTETGCVFNGTVSVLDNRYNLLNVAVTTGGDNTCATVGKNATLSGLAYYTPANGSTAASLTAIAANATGGYFAFYSKTSS